MFLYYLQIRYNRDVFKLFGEGLTMSRKVLGKNSKRIIYLFSRRLYLVTATRIQVSMCVNMRVKTRLI